jgi:PAS domain S-box-containing protein
MSYGVRLQGEARPELRAGAARILQVSLLALLLGALGVALIAALAGDVKAFGGAAVIAVVSPVLLLLLRRGFTRLAMNTAVSMLLAVACVEVCIGDGTRDIGIGLFTVVVLVSALLLERGSSLAFSVLSVLSVAAIGAAELAGLLTTPLSHTVRPGELAILVFLNATFAVLIHAVTRALYRGLEDAALSEQTYREIWNATSEGIFVHDPESGRVLDVNQTACAITGYSRAELLAMTLDQLAQPLPESSESGLRQLLHRARHEGPQTCEWTALRKDGNAIWLDVAARTARIRGEARVLVAVRDVSDRKAAAERLHAAEQLRVIGQLAGGVAHDFNNQLTGIVANATLLKDMVRGEPAGEACIGAILHCSSRSADLTRQLLAFARKGDRRQEVVDVDVLVQDSASLLARSIDKRVAIELDLAGEGRARVVGDAAFLESALVNLGLNARDAMPRGGVLRFETRMLSADRLPARARAQLVPSASDYVCVRVSDTGIGIEPDALSRIFEPFFTTKPHGHGLGLSAAFGTVHAHRGTMLVTSAAGAGTTLEVLLPATDEPLAHHAAPQPLPPLEGVHVLLAEDEQVVGRATELLLQELGCSVTWCRDGREALDAFERDPDTFDVMMLDHSMPGLLGSEVAERATSLRPRLPIIATSGFAESTGQQASMPNRIVLPKPFDLEQLTAALGHALSR